MPVRMEVTKEVLSSIQLWLYCKDFSPLRPMLISRWPMERPSPPLWVDINMLRVSSLQVGLFTRSEYLLCIVETVQVDDVISLEGWTDCTVSPFALL